MKERKPYRPTKETLDRLIAKYDEKTAAITVSQAMDLMDTEETNHFLMLLQLADFYPMGKSIAIIYAYKLGYLDGKGGVEA